MSIEAEDYMDNRFDDCGDPFCPLCTYHYNYNYSDSLDEYEEDDDF